MFKQHQKMTLEELFIKCQNVQQKRIENNEPNYVINYSSSSINRLRIMLSLMDKINCDLIASGYITIIYTRYDKSYNKSFIKLFIESLLFTILLGSIMIIIGICIK